MDKITLINNIQQHKNNPKTVFEWIDFFAYNNDKQKEFITLVDELVNDYTLILKDNKLILGVWENYYSGEVKLNRRGFGFLDFDDHPSIFINSTQLKDVFDNDTIVVLYDKYTKEATLVKIVKRALETIVGNIYTKRRPYKFISDNKQYNNKINILNFDEYKKFNRYKVVLKVIHFENNKINCLIDKVLGSIFDSKIDIYAALAAKNIYRDWPEATIKQLSEMDLETIDSSGRLDLNKTLTFTIDGADAKDLDDAVSIELKNNNYLLGVHIMDVSHYVKENSPIDKEAFRRGTSVYASNYVVSMLPKELSNGICSLNQDEERLAISVFMEINKKGKVVNTQIKESVITSKAKLTYSIVNDFYDNKEVSLANDIKESLTLMKQLSDILSNKFSGINFDQDEIYLEMDDLDNVIDIRKRDRGQSEKLIENFMVLTNDNIAKLMYFSEWPAIYRVHQKPEVKKLVEFSKLASILGYSFKSNLQQIHPSQLQKVLELAKDDDNYFILSLEMLKSMQKAYYSQNNLGHFGLGLTEYAHFTAPIRRYSDLTLHRMVKKYYLNHDFSNYDNDFTLMEKVAKATSISERNAISAERAVIDMKVAEYMEDKVGEIYNGTIVSLFNFGFFVTLDNLVDGLVKAETLKGQYVLSEDQYTLFNPNSKHSYKIGQKIKVRVTYVNVREGKIDLAVTNNKG